MGKNDIQQQKQQQQQQQQQQQEQQQQQQQQQQQRRQIIEQLEGVRKMRSEARARAARRKCAGSTEDQRKGNQGAGSRHRYSAIQKWAWIKKYENWKQRPENASKTLANFSTEHQLTGNTHGVTRKWEKFLGEGKTSWRNAKARRKTMQRAASAYHLCFWWTIWMVNVNLNSQLF